MLYGLMHIPSGEYIYVEKRYSRHPALFSKSLTAWINSDKIRINTNENSIYGFYLGSSCETAILLSFWNQKKLQKLCEIPRFRRNIAMDMFPELDSRTIPEQDWPLPCEFEIVPIKTDRSTCELWHSL